MNHKSRASNGAGYAAAVLPEVKKHRVTKPRGLEARRGVSRVESKGKVYPRGFHPGNGQVVDPASTVTSRSNKSQQKTARQ